MKRVAATTLWCLVFIFVLSASAAKAQKPGLHRDLTFSVGLGTGDYNNSFVAGISWSSGLYRFIHGEVELFYYRMPAPKSDIPGEAITSTAIDFNLSGIAEPKLPKSPVTPYALVSFGQLYESETWKYSATKTHTHRSYGRLNIGIGVGAKVIVSKTSGLRLDFRWIQILGKNQQIPRYSLGYVLFF